jgi:hypothetical protein
VTTRTARCSRGRLLREHGQAAWKASAYVGTRGVSGAAQLMLQESRGKVVRELCVTWGSRQVLPHMERIFAILIAAERREIG